MPWLLEDKTGEMRWHPEPPRPEPDIEDPEDQGVITIPSGLTVMIWQVIIPTRHKPTFYDSEFEDEKSYDKAKAKFEDELCDYNEKIIELANIDMDRIAKVGFFTCSCNDDNSFLVLTVFDHPADINTVRSLLRSSDDVAVHYFSPSSVEDIINLREAHKIPKTKIKEHVTDLKKRFMWSSQDGAKWNDWVSQIAMSADALRYFVDRWKLARDPELFFKLCADRLQPDVNRRKFNFLVDGLIPAGEIVLLAGMAEVGKSSLATELAVAVAPGSTVTTFLGQAVTQADGLVIMLSGEDSETVVSARRAQLDPDNRAGILVFADSQTLIECLTSLQRVQKSSLLIVDPARKFMTGDEDSSDVVNRFYTQLEEFSRRTGAAVLVLAHLRKGSQPKSLADVRGAIRGSQVMVDRPRVVIAMYRSGAVTHVGVAKSNMPPPIVMMPDRSLIRDPATLRHIPADGDEANATADAPTSAAVLTTVQRLTDRGIKITRTGKAGLFEQAAPELVGVSRVKLRTTIKALVAEGKLADGDAGLRCPK